jgi:hypothetical protein
MFLANPLKGFWAIPTIPSVIVSRGTLVSVHIFQALGKTGTRKIVCDAKVTDSFNEFFDDGTGGETVAYAFGLLISVIVGQRILI